MFSKVLPEKEVRKTLYIKKRTHKAIESAIRCIAVERVTQRR